METGTLSTNELSPFGLEVTSKTAGEIASVPTRELKDWIAANRFVLLRGFAPLSTDSLMSLARTLGEPLEWEFGAINELVAKTDAKNYIYTTAGVPFHWDGAFVGKIPHYILFSCEVAPATGSGGETIFCDGNRVLQGARPEQRVLWNATSITYSCERVVHYGGKFTSPMVVHHPASGEETLRFAEPVQDLNPVALEIPSLSPPQRDALIEEMTILLRDPKNCAEHAWSAGDVLIADNYALLHGRKSFKDATRRHIRRVNIL
jgi:alpha-ketoglutarate-dependent taurine dioxygenase